MALRVIDWAELTAGTGAGPEGLTTLISGLITRGQLREGDRLPSERDFAELLGTSRATVREAILELELKGLVDRKRGRGTVITPAPEAAGGLLGALEATQRSLNQMQDLRTAVEPSIAARAALRATRADIALLREILDEAETGPLTAARSVELDERFHAGVARAAQNPLLVAVVETTAGWIGEVRRESHRTAAARHRSHDGHREILRAIAEGDPAAAEAAMNDHLHTVSTLIRQD